MTLPGDHAGAPRSPSYRVHVAFGDERRPLRAGMTFRADILLERRRIIEWLFEPWAAAAASL